MKKRPGEKNHCEAAEADQSPGEGERQQGQKKRRAKTHSYVGERDTHKVHARSEDDKMWNPLRHREPVDQRVTQRHPEDGLEKPLPRTQWKRFLHSRSDR